MYVCICNAVTDKQIRRAADNGVIDLWGLQRELGVAAGCGSCKEAAMSIVREQRHRRTDPQMYMPEAG